MKTQMTLTCLVALLVLSGCANKSKDDSADNSNLCPAAVVDAFNEISNQAQLYVKTKEKNYLVGIQNSCNQYKSLIGAGSCVATELKSGQPLTLDQNSGATLCERAEKALAAEPPSTPVNSDPGAVKITDLKQGFKFLVQDATLINQLLTAGSTLLIQDGHTVANPREINSSHSFCFLTKKDPAVEVHAGDVLEMQLVQPDGRRLIVASKDQKLEMSCGKTDYFTDWTLAHLSQVFGPSAEISAIVEEIVTP